jgi:hypothetical protein
MAVMADCWVPGCGNGKQSGWARHCDGLSRSGEWIEKWRRLMCIESAGLIWVEGIGGGWRYFKTYRRMKKHKGRERVEIVIRGKKKVVPVEKVKRWPVEVLGK